MKSIQLKLIKSIETEEKERLGTRHVLNRLRDLKGFCFHDLFKVQGFLLESNMDVLLLT